MKKTVTAVFSLLFTILFVAFFIAPKSYGQVPTNVEQSVLTRDISVEKADATMSALPQRVNYELAYPGMLPDNPLYFLKMIRDRIVKILITDTLKKAEFDLLNAEKRMYAAQFLVDKKKYELAITTASKSNNYFDEAIVEVASIQSRPADTLSLLQKMKTVIAKNEEVLSDIIKTTNGSSKVETDKIRAAFIAEERRAQKLENSVDKLILEKSSKKK